MNTKRRETTEGELKCISIHWISQVFRSIKFQDKSFFWYYISSAIRFVGFCMLSASFTAFCWLKQNAVTVRSSRFFMGNSISIIKFIHLCCCIREVRFCCCCINTFGIRNFFYKLQIIFKKCFKISSNLLSVNSKIILDRFLSQ